MQSVFIFIGTGIFHRVEPLVYSPFFACRMDGEFLFLFVLRFARFLISFVKKIGTRTIIYYYLHYGKFVYYVWIKIM